MSSKRQCGKNCLCVIPILIQVATWIECVFVFHSIFFALFHFHLGASVPHTHIEEKVWNSQLVLKLCLFFQMQRNGLASRAAFILFPSKFNFHRSHTHKQKQENFRTQRDIAITHKREKSEVSKLQQQHPTSALPCCAYNYRDWKRTGTHTSIK